MIELYFIAYIPCFFIQSLVQRHVVCFCNLPTVDNAAINLCPKISETFSLLMICMSVLVCNLLKKHLPASCI